MFNDYSRQFDDAARELLEKRLIYTDYRAKIKPGVDAYGLHATEIGWAVIKQIWPEIAKQTTAPGSPLKLISATYGAGVDRMDVLSILISHMINNALSIKVVNDVFEGDPAPNQSKRLHIIYSYDGEIHEKEFPEGHQLSLP